MIAEQSTIALAGPLAGAGVDIVTLHRVSGRLARAKFSEAETVAFAASREVPFAAREAVLKAVGGPGILSAPLKDMVVAWQDGELSFRPTARYRDVMSGRGVEGVHLTMLPLSPSHVIVTALAFRAGPATRVAQSYAALAVSAAWIAEVDDDERAECHRRHDPHPSAAARIAARRAVAPWFPDASPRVRGARDEPPTLVGVPQSVHLSLAHEGDLAVALVAMQAADGGR